MHGEFDNKDSIHIADSLKYKTLKGRTVYGGGGIMPDVFVSRDTTDYTPYLNKVINYGYTYQYAFKYTDRNRKKLQTIKDWKKMEEYLKKQPLIEEFTVFAAEKGVKPNINQINISKRFLEMQLRAYIARNILGDEGFYPLFYKDDITVLKAIEVINKRN
jgi:carboxyl-terminal processing protease